VWGLGCERCAQWKVGCSAVGLKRKDAERKVEQRVAMEDMEEGLVAPLKLSDGVMEQVEAMAKELRKISGGIWVLVKGVRKLMEVVEGMGRIEVAKVDKETEIEEVQKVDRQMETEGKEEDSEEEEDKEKEKTERRTRRRMKKKVMEWKMEKKDMKSK
jgi:hypothetical protein